MVGMIPRDQLFRNQSKYFSLRILTQSRHNFVLIYFLTASIVSTSGLSIYFVVVVGDYDQFGSNVNCSKNRRNMKLIGSEIRKGRNRM